MLIPTDLTGAAVGDICGITMRIRFSKWQGTGNDFVLVDDREGLYAGVGEQAARVLCDRHFGVGADGLILVRPPQGPGMAFHMDFHNPDGSQSFCGNGSRCAFAFWLQVSGRSIGPDQRIGFTAVDGAHAARSLPDGWVAVAMRPPVQGERISGSADHWHTGSPHVVQWVSDPEEVDVVGMGRAVRQDERFAPGGVNVNFVAIEKGVLHMRTYERGVEDETLSCGTGVTAAAWSAWERGHVSGERVEVRTRGGDLVVELLGTGAKREAWLCGPAREVFNGDMLVP